ncbi:uncharacterized protein LOC133847999 isoform X1 [Drosophila sulfurigaster albostrigata]|uniref:uncharacterized protein LOC133847999 isoform X1 n=1 Tax=Drosophila sulfurigaster albostrigata TaxID=89887 RepID=UPI002D21DCB8|nr:uncharacterized protein LOC133847999 isoform X1 [Drosophila sulfurigaster albostrigata]
MRASKTTYAACWRISKLLDALVDTFAISGTNTVHLPALVQLVETQTQCQIIGCNRMRQVLFVGKHHQHTVAQLVHMQHRVQLRHGFGETLRIRRIYHEYNACCIIVIVTPHRAHTLLSPNVPDGETQSPMLEHLHIKANRWYAGQTAAQLQLIQRCRLAGFIQADHQ